MPSSDIPAGGHVGDYVVFWIVWAGIVAAAVAFVRRARRRPSRARLVAGNLLVLLAFLWTAAVAGETWLRYVHDTTDSYGLLLTTRSWFARHVRLNSRGFREREPAAARPGAVRVACVGDSFTFGHGVRDAADCWPQRLGAALERDAPGGFDVRNYGEVGQSTLGALELTAGIVGERSADRVVLGYCLNDIEDLLPRERRFERGDVPPVPWIPPTASFVADHLWHRFALRGAAHSGNYFGWVTEAYLDPAILARQEARFRALADVCRRGGVRLDVVVLPFFSAWGGEYPFDRCHDAVARAWASAGVDVVDLRAAIRGVDGADLVVGRRDAHPNERAHDLVAREVRRRLFVGR